MKIHVTGNAGSGKTTLAKALGEISGLNVYGLDNIVWQAGWQKTPLAERKLLEQKLVNHPDWIIEGVSSIARQSADFIVFLDYPRHICFFRSIRRSFRYLFSSRPELPENCPEIKILPQLIKIIWQFPEVAKPEICNDLSKVASVRIHSNQELHHFIKNVRNNKSLKSNLLNQSQATSKWNP